MASYLEIKQLLKNVLCIEPEVDETCDMLIPVHRYGEEASNILLTNEMLKEVFDRIQPMHREKLELFTGTSREVALQFFAPFTRRIAQDEPITDTVNGLSYSIGPASPEYCMFLLDCVADHIRENGRGIQIDLRHRSRNILGQRAASDLQNGNPWDLLPVILRTYTLKVCSDCPVVIRKLAICIHRSTDVGRTKPGYIASDTLRTTASSSLE